MIPVVGNVACERVHVELGWGGAVEEGLFPSVEFVTIPSVEFVTSQTILNLEGKIIVGKSIIIKNEI